MSRAIAALPIALGLLGANLDTSSGPNEFGLTAADRLAIESTTVNWPAHNTGDPDPHTVFGVPEYEHHDDDVNMVREYEGFTVYYDDEVLGPRWTAIKLTDHMVDRNSDFARPSRFSRDDVIEDAGYETTVHDDYKNPSGSRKWARGHIVQFDDARGWGDQTGEDSFFTSNIAPQLQDHNGKGWLSLEETVSEFARDYETVWVYTGPIYSSNPRPFASGRKVPKPKAFYKVVVSPGEGGSVDVLAFIMKHKEIERGADLTKFLVSVDKVEQETDIDFLHELPDAVEDALERVVWEIWPDLPNA